MVEKIKRDVRITTIYEGTSEIMEWTIARDRWQLHLKSRGQYYLDWAGRAEARHAQSPNVGAGLAALALRALGAPPPRARPRRGGGAQGGGRGPALGHRRRPDRPLSPAPPGPRRRRRRPGRPRRGHGQDRGGPQPGLPSE